LPLSIPTDHKELRKDSTLRHPRRRPLRSFPATEYPLSGFGSLTEFHQCITANRRCCLQHTMLLAPSEVCSPSAFCRPQRATYLRQIPSLPVTLRPQGFSPSRRLAPLVACRAYFIPVPLLGLTLRGFDPHVTPYVLSNAESLRVSSSSSEKQRIPPQGLTRHTKHHHRAWGLIRFPQWLPPWAWSPSRFLASGSLENVVSVHHPLSYFFDSAAR